jgi:hypothetical protein
MKLNINHDKVTTVLGAVGAVITATNPIIGGVTSGVLHSGDWMQLAMAALMALYGYSTNKQTAVN